jgi:hypothetical protein
MRYVATFSLSSFEMARYVATFSLSSFEMQAILDFEAEPIPLVSDKAKRSIADTFLEPANDEGCSSEVQLLLDLFETDDTVFDAVDVPSNDFSNDPLFQSMMNDPILSLERTKSVSDLIFDDDDDDITGTL